MKLLKSKIDNLLKQKEIYQENYNQLSAKMEEMQDVINNNGIETMENVDNNSDSTNILWLLEARQKENIKGYSRYSCTEFDSTYS